MYSQNDEEFHILEYFGSLAGRFLDVGAADGSTFSNTLALSERGWSGICIEPDPVCLEGLQATHGANPDIMILPVAISPADGKVKFYSSHGALVSSLSPAHVAKWSSAAQFDPIEVQSMPPEVFLDLHPGPFPFFNLDVEGLNAELLECFPLSKMGVELLCVEHDCQDDRILTHCKRHGLTRVLTRNAENLIIGK